MRLLRAEAGDRGFLFALYAADRAPAFAALSLPAVQLNGLLESQWRARDAAYARRFPGAEAWVVVADGCDVGYLLLEAAADAVRVLEFSIAPERRGCGYGGAAMRQVQAMAEQSGRAVTLRVQAQSAALRLYRRLGFRVASDEKDHLQMRWKLAAVESSAELRSCDPGPVAPASVLPLHLEG